MTNVTRLRVLSWRGPGLELGGAAIRISNSRANGRVSYKMGGDEDGEPISVTITGGTG